MTEFFFFSPEKYNAFLLFFSFIVVLGGVHCGIYKVSYNVPTIAYLNSPLPSHGRNSFSKESKAFFY
jgi:hypothetical protein